MTRSIRTVGLLVVMVWSVAAYGQTTAVTSSTTMQSEKAGKSPLKVSRLRPPSDAAIAVLGKRVETVDWVDTPFEDVISWINDEADGRVNVIPRWGMLSVESVDRDTLVNLQLNNTTVGQVLFEVIDSISDDEALAFHAFGSTLKISTKADFDRKLYLRIYDVTDVLFRIEDFGRDSPLIDLQQSSGGGGGGGGQSVFSGSGGSGGNQQGGEQAEQEFLERLENLAEIVQEVIAPTSWDTQAGGRGRLRVLNRSLLVVNTIEVHEQLAGAFSLGG